LKQFEAIIVYLKCPSLSDAEKERNSHSRFSLPAADVNNTVTMKLRLLAQIRVELGAPARLGTATRGETPMC